MFQIPAFTCEFFVRINLYCYLGNSALETNIVTQEISSNVNVHFKEGMFCSGTCCNP
jgi:hypothetical protein